MASTILTIISLLLSIGAIPCLILAGISLYKGTKANDIIVSILYERDMWKWVCVTWICSGIANLLRLIATSI